MFLDFEMFLIFVGAGAILANVGFLAEEYRVHGRELVKEGREQRLGFVIFMTALDSKLSLSTLMQSTPLPIKRHLPTVLAKDVPRAIRFQ